MLDSKFYEKCHCELTLVCHCEVRSKLEPES